MTASRWNPPAPSALRRIPRCSECTDAGNKPCPEGYPAAYTLKPTAACVKGRKQS